jgi:hypothetical protein
MPNRLILLSGGVEKGTFTPAEIVEMAREGKIAAYDFLCREGDTRWVPAGSVRPLADLLGDILPARQKIEALFEIEEVAAPAQACPRCGAAADADAAFCTVCGADFSGGEPGRGEAICPQCGRTSTPDSLFCTGCGRRLDAPEEVSPEIPPRRTGAPSEKPPREKFLARTPTTEPGGRASPRRVLVFGGAAAAVAAVVLAAGVLADRFDNGHLDGSIIGYESGAGEDADASAGEVLPQPAEEASGKAEMSFEVVSAYGGGRSRRDVMDGLRANEERIGEAFAGAGPGEATARITVARSGAVVRAEVESSSFSDPASINKVAYALRTCTLDAAAGTTVAVVKFAYEG